MAYDAVPPYEGLVAWCSAAQKPSLSNKTLTHGKRHEGKVLQYDNSNKTWCGDMTADFSTSSTNRQRTRFIVTGLAQFSTNSANRQKPGCTVKRLTEFSTDCGDVFSAIDGWDDACSLCSQRHIVCAPPGRLRQAKQHRHHHRTQCANDNSS